MMLEQLDVIDHCYTLESVNKFHYGASLSVFITDKTFKLKNRTLVDITLYAKIEYTTEGYVCVVSIYLADSKKFNLYK